MNLSKQTLTHITRACACLGYAQVNPRRAGFYLVEASLAARRAADLHHARQLAASKRRAETGRKSKSKRPNTLPHLLAHL